MLFFRSTKRKLAHDTQIGLQDEITKALLLEQVISNPEVATHLDFRIL